MKLKKKAVLIGPFIGCYQWEMSVFVPHVLERIKQDRSKTYIVFTRPSMFDLYGKFVDILVPLNIKDNCDIANGYYNSGITEKLYNELTSKFIKRYSKRYKISEVICPNIAGFMRQVKWQFKRNHVLFLFKPRGKNKQIVKELYDYKDYVVTNLNTKIQCERPVVNLNDLYNTLSKKELFNHDFTFFGCAIEIIRNASLFIGTFKNVYNLPLLLRTSTLLTENMSGDDLFLVNPLKTPVVLCSDIDKGLHFYEDNF